MRNATARKIRREQLLLGVGDLASTPVLNELRHPAGTPQVTVALTQPFSQRNGAW